MRRRSAMHWPASRKPAKETVAIGQVYGQSQYAIASFADAVYLHSGGALYLPGYEVIQPYYKSLFDKLKLNVHVFRVGTYKAAVEPFIRDDMSDAAREANQEMVDGLWAAYRQRILTNRQLDNETFDGYTEAFDAALAQAGGDMARAALESGLVDELMSADQMRSRIAATVGWDDGRNFNGIGYSDYLGTLGPRPSEPGNVGLIFVRGIIQMGDDKSAAAADNLVALIRQVREDDAVKALVVRVDSPGGSAFASELIREELELVQIAGKPLVMSMGSVAASGGYWISSTADRHPRPSHDDYRFDRHLCLSPHHGGIAVQHRCAYRWRRQFLPGRHAGSATGLERADATRIAVQRRTRLSPFHQPGCPRAQHDAGSRRRGGARSCLARRTGA